MTEKNNKNRKLNRLADKLVGKAILSTRRGKPGEIIKSLKGEELELVKELTEKHFDSRIFGKSS